MWIKNPFSSPVKRGRWAPQALGGGGRRTPLIQESSRGRWSPQALGGGGLRLWPSSVAALPPLFALALSLFAAAPAANAADIAASAPRTLSVTIYRAPNRGEGGIELDDLQGFALVTETRLVDLPAGESRLRFQGVVDGVVPESALVTGLPGVVIEKNRDAALLSPETLARASVGGKVMLRRTDPRTGKMVMVPATIRSARDKAVVFETAEGVEAVQCSGRPETFSFARVPAGLFATPTLSVLVRAPRPVRAVVTLSYLTEAFDWSADYVATVSPNDAALDLGAWITLANGNAVSLPNARTQIVAGALNRVSSAGPVRLDFTFVGRCWPMETTNTLLAPALSGRAMAMAAPKVIAPPPMVQPRPMAVMAMRPMRPPDLEQLGDLKLYRLNLPTTVAANQAKQVRLMEQPGVAIQRLYQDDLWAEGEGFWSPAKAILRTRNDKAHKLGLPLPAGRLILFENGPRGRQVTGEAKIADTAVDEDLDIKLGPAPDVQVRATRRVVTTDAPAAKLPAPGHETVLQTVEVRNDSPRAIAFELRLRLNQEGRRIINPDHPMALKDGRPIFRLEIPAGVTETVRYRVTD